MKIEIVLLIGELIAMVVIVIGSLVVTGKRLKEDIESSLSFCEDKTAVVLSSKKAVYTSRSGRRRVARIVHLGNSKISVRRGNGSVFYRVAA